MACMDEEKDKNGGKDGQDCEAGFPHCSPLIFLPVLPKISGIVKILWQVASEKIAGVYKSVKEINACVNKNCGVCRCTPIGVQWVIIIINLDVVMIRTP
jgi:hypothetical protein